MRVPVCCLIFGGLITLALGEAFLSVRFISFENYGGRGSNGHCCDGRFSICFSKCDHSFTICLDHINGLAYNADWCAFGSFTSGEIRNANSITFGRTIGNIANPVIWRLKSWPGKTLLKIKVVDDDDHNSDDHVDSLQSVLSLQPIKSSKGSHISIRNRVQLNVEAYVYCGQNYYTQDCSVYCKPTNDYTGHFTCNEDGAKICLSGWTGPNCQMNENNCIGIECKNGGFCQDMLNAYKCVCQPGFNGHFCETDINECLNPSVCSYGDCVNTPGSYKCVCHSGYTGKTCSDDINECLPSPCKNGASCKDLIGAFQCTCPVGFTGDLCDNDINECQLEPCNNNGTCVNYVGGYRCDCLTGFHGNDCLLDIDECDRFPCKNEGVCINYDGGYSCQCHTGFEGLNCDKDINECKRSSTLCHNGGHCLNTHGSYSCQCQRGYTGHNCEQDENECLSDPCQHEGTCHNLPGSFKCVCKEGYTGNYCEQNINECMDDVCKNGGNCTDLDGGFLCLCPVFWLGKTCEKNVNECLSDPCQHGGTCQDVDEGFLCICPTEFIGKLCEADMNECELETTCENNATCINGFGHFACECLKGWKGLRCEQDINECERGYCNNLGTCINMVGGVHCDCPINWQGERCEVDVNECELQTLPCRNNATCHNLVGTFHCECAEGWTGSLCGQDLDECLQDPDICKTIGNSSSSDNSTNDHIVCFNSIPGFQCTCTEGWTGLMCDEDVNECIEDPYICSLYNKSEKFNITDREIIMRPNWRCLNTVPGYTCSCGEGWTGQDCDTYIEEHSSLPTPDSMDFESNLSQNYDYDSTYKNGNEYVTATPEVVDYISSDQTLETGTPEPSMETNFGLNESQILNQNNETSNGTELSVPFYLNCQMASRPQWSINKGLTQIFEKTNLFHGKKLTVTHREEKETSETGEMVTSIYPIVTVDGRLLSNSEITSILNKAPRTELEDQLSCSLFLGAIKAKASFSTSSLNSATPDWYPAIITAGATMLVLIVVLIIVKNRRKIQTCYQNMSQVRPAEAPRSYQNDLCIDSVFAISQLNSHWQPVNFQQNDVDTAPLVTSEAKSKSPAMSILNPLYISANDVHESMEDVNCKGLEVNDENKSHANSPDNISDGKPSKFAPEQVNFTGHFDAAPPHVNRTQDGPQDPGYVNVTFERMLKNEDEDHYSFQKCKNTGNCRKKVTDNPYVNI